MNRTMGGLEDISVAILWSRGKKSAQKRGKNRINRIKSWFRENKKEKD